MKKIFLAILLVSFVGISFGAGSKKTVTGKYKFEANYVTTYVNSQVDTVIYNMDGSESGTYGTFGAAFLDSVSITNVIVKRVINNQVQATIVGDSVTATIVGTSDTGTGKLATFSLDPKADQLWFIVTYAGSANGTTTPTVKYVIHKLLPFKP